jgi:hypothetical protein
MEFSAPSEEEKRSTAEYAEIAELFLGIDKKHKSFQRYGPLFVLRSSGDREKELNEEEAESAEVPLFLFLILCVLRDLCG